VFPVVSTERTLKQPYMNSPACTGRDAFLKANAENVDVYALVFIRKPKRIFGFLNLTAPGDAEQLR